MPPRRPWSAPILIGLWTCPGQDDCGQPRHPQAKRALEKDHYNLEKVKERILEYLSVRKLKKKMKGPILCFIGPPGRKDSLGKSIARALGENSSGSLLGYPRRGRNPGHRRTYVGPCRVALPSP